MHITIITHILIQDSNSPYVKQEFGMLKVSAVFTFLSLFSRFWVSFGELQKMMKCLKAYKTELAAPTHFKGLNSGLSVA